MYTVYTALPVHCAGALSAAIFGKKLQSRASSKNPDHWTREAANHLRVGVRVRVRVMVRVRGRGRIKVRGRVRVRVRVRARVRVRVVLGL